MKSKTYYIKEDSVLEALEGVERLMEVMTKINEDKGKTFYEYVVGIDPIDGERSKCEIHITLITKDKDD